jgi:hypothetical protein
MIRHAASPGAAVALERMNTEIDVRQVLPAIRVPTLVLNRSGDAPFIVEGSRHLAERSPGAMHLELAGRDHAMAAGDVEPVLEAVGDFLTRAWSERASEDSEPDRVLATVLFTDLVGSTAKAVELGDAGWRELLTEHNVRVRQELARFRGREIDTRRRRILRQRFRRSGARDPVRHENRRLTR